MGNHEAQFLANPPGSATKEFANELREASLDPKKVANCEGAIGEFLCALPIAARVNEGFFSHGGNTGDRSMEQIAEDIEKGYAAKNPNGDEYRSQPSNSSGRSPFSKRA